LQENQKPDLIGQRYAKLEQIKQLGHAAYPHSYNFSHTLPQILDAYQGWSKEQLDAERIDVRICGRLVAMRGQGKAGFSNISSGSHRLQIYTRLDEVGEANFSLYQLLDIGDLIGVTGYLFRTKTNELSVHAQKIDFLAKSFLPLPEKWHGLSDVEIRYRQRYLDLISNHESRQVFVTRSKIIKGIRDFLDARGYIEVETPMMQPLAGGATARPFKTHHNALGMDLFLRIAPELYLKRLLVGGFEKVYELNRNFRNEGISSRHNPEFTMLEFYWAYADVNEMMDFCEELIRAVVFRALGHTHVKFGDFDIDFAQPFRRVSMKGSLSGSVTDQEITNDNVLELFESRVEHQLIQPTFITEFPKAISPLSKASPSDPSVAERFELYISGMEIANGFSELNDPSEQYERFREQMKQRERGDEEAMVMDEDYIRALSYGMPPAAGIGIGIDRLVMLLTNKQSIRDVILFPHLRPERKSSEPDTN